MAAHSGKRHRLRWLLIALPVFFLSCCGLGDVFWLGDDPFERLQEAQPLASVPPPLNGPPYRNHARDRDELVFVVEGAPAQLAVYRIDARLTRTRVVPIPADKLSRFGNVSAFPLTPRAVLYEPHENADRMVIVSTETGEVLRTITLPEVSDGLVTSIRDVVVSPEERWLALELAKTRVDGANSVQEGWRPTTVLDLQSGDVFELINPREPADAPSAFAFVGANSLFVQCSPSGDRQLWHLPTCQLKWVMRAEHRDLEASSAVSDGSRLVIGSHSECQVLDAETGKVIRSHRGTRPASAVSLHPNGDYLAGYSSLNYALFGSYLNGAVRTWDAAGGRRTTVLVDQRPGWRTVQWLALSRAGDYLVVGCHDDVKVWDYHTLFRH